MSETYRIGEVVKSMGVGQYTLKHYERAGLVKPTVDEESGYRYYTYRDFGRLILVRNLRTMGFSVEAARDFFEMDFADREQRMAEQYRENCAEIVRLERANRAIEFRKSALAEAMGHLDNWRMAAMPPLNFVPHFNEEQITDEFRIPDDAELWRDFYEFADLALRLQGNLAEEDDVSLEWGLCSLGLVGQGASSDGERIGSGNDDETHSCLSNVIVIERAEDVKTPLSSIIRDALQSRGLSSHVAYGVQRGAREEGGQTELLLSLYVMLDISGE